jgi:16S rRNA U516 pseudouridylate synthase RsuA-like enzyme
MYNHSTLKLFAIFFDRKLEFTLIEGRNRQKMVEAIGMVALHRVSFGGIKLKGSSLGT